MFKAPENGDNLLIVRNDRLGDTILALPALQSLRTSYPTANIYFWCAPNLEPLLSCVDGICGVLTFYDANRSNFIQTLRQYNFSAAYCLYPTFYNALTLNQARIKDRYGTSRRWYSFLFNRRINLPRRGAGRHEADLNLDLLAAAGGTRSNNFPRISLPQAVLSSVNLLLKDAGVHDGRNYAVVHPGSGGSAQNWPPAYFRQLAGMIRSQLDLHVVVTGVAKEAEICREVAGSEYINLCGKLNLLQLAALLKNARILVANSTGPLHLGIALGTLSIGIYTPLRDCLPDRWGPYGHPEFAIMPDVPVCRKCTSGEFSPCHCLEQLKSEQVFERVQETLGRR